MSNEERGNQIFERIGEAALGTSAKIVGRAIYDSPTGDVVGKAVDVAMSHSPKEAKVGAGMGALFGATVATKALVIGGGVALLPALPAIAAGAVVCGVFGFTAGCIGKLLSGKS
jgi:hypothetical protein